MIEKDTLIINKRIVSIDLLRGVVMVLMALDHVRDYFYVNYLLDPTDLTQTSAALFSTRWITHFCAPVFFFLTGTAAFLAGQKLSDKKALSWWLLTRGIWLILLEFTLIKFAWGFTFDYSYILLIVIWALGCCMIALSLLIYLPGKVLLALGLLIVMCHNLLDPVVSFANPALNVIWKILHVESELDIYNVILSVQYPILPWIGVTALGYCFGQLYSPSFDRSKRIKLLWWLGSLTILAFVVIRFTNFYGDLSKWTEQKNILFTLFSFVNLTKYPPSLLYICMTLGPAIIFLAFTENRQGWLAKKIITIGRVPFFYYIVHLYIIHLAASLAAMATGYRWSDFVFDSDWTPDRLKGYGFNLWVVYGVWAGIVLLIYPLCSWFNDIKKRNPHIWWLKYL